MDLPEFVGFVVFMCVVLAGMAYAAGKINSWGR